MEHRSTDGDGRGSDRRRPAALSGLGTKIILLVFASTLVTALLVSWISIQNTSGSLRRLIERLYPSSLNHAAQRVGPWIQNTRLLLGYADTCTGDASPLESEDLAGAFDGLARIGASGRLERHWGEFPEASAAALEHPERLAPVTLADGRAALAVAPLWSTKHPQWVAVVALERLEPLFELELPSPDAMLALLDPEGRVLLRVGRPPGPRPIDRISLGALHARGALRETELAGAHVIGASQPIDLLGWHVAVVTPFEAAYGPVLSMVTRVLAIDLCIILAFSLLAYRFTARLVRPIGLLSEAARRVTDGDSDVEVPRIHSRDEIGLLSRTFDDMLRRQMLHREEIEDTNRRLTDRNARLEHANEVLSQLSITDGLTKLHNHRFFQDHLTREIRRVERAGEALAILLLDIDDFKRLNDRFGHAAGDEILARLAQILNDAVRASDLCARYGGEEFVVLAPGTEVEGAYRLAEKVRTAIAESSFIVDDSLRPLRVTVSVGVAAFRGNRKRFFQKADQALYQAKANGKNCVVVHDDDCGEDGEPGGL